MDKPGFPEHIKRLFKDASLDDYTRPVAGTCPGCSSLRARLQKAKDALAKIARLTLGNATTHQKCRELLDAIREICIDGGVSMVDL